MTDDNSFSYVKMYPHQPAIYKLGDDRHVKGYAIESSNGLCWFNTTERMANNLWDLLVSRDDVLMLVK